MKCTKRLFDVRWWYSYVDQYYDKCLVVNINTNEHVGKYTEKY